VPPEIRSTRLFIDVVSGAGPVANAHQSFVEMLTPPMFISFLVTFLGSKVELCTKVKYGGGRACIPFTAMISLLTRKVWFE
jgi:hypothetical protein